MASVRAAFSRFVASSGIHGGTRLSNIDRLETYELCLVSRIHSARVIIQEALVGESEQKYLEHNRCFTVYIGREALQGIFDVDGPWLPEGVL